MIIHFFNKKGETVAPTKSKVEIPIAVSAIATNVSVFRDIWY